MSHKRQIIECVPNFSEGRNMSVIKQITDEIESVSGVKLLDVDPGEATNRTVVTFVGSPEDVTEAAFRAVRCASQLIDMRQHHGAHPRMGATDVLPLIPVSGITLEECAALARQLADRIAREAGIPCYCYEAAAFTEERKNLAVCRQGEYEALQEKLTTPGKQPDFMPEELNNITDPQSPIPEQILKSGCTAVGARDFLIAVNFNLNTTSTRRANAIAFDVREKGRPMREGGSITGKIMRYASGEPIMQPGTLKATKAIGWYIDEYGIAQVSMNITNLNVTPLHKAFDEVCYFLAKQQRSTGIPEADIIKIAIKSMGLDDLKPFNPREKVIEYMLDDAQQNAGTRLADLTIKAFAEETSRESPAPGGGTIAAYMGALGAALGTMVANLSSHKAGWDDRWHHFSSWAEKGQQNAIMAAFGLPKATEADRKQRAAAIEAATLHATEIPLETMNTALQAFDICKAMASEGNPNSVSDAGVGALAARAAVLGAALNVKINASALSDKAAAKNFIEQADTLAAKADAEEKAIMEIVENKIAE